MTTEAPALWSSKISTDYWNPEMGIRGKGVNLNKVQIAYIAGIIDGEGHISITRNKSNTCKRGYRHRVQIAVTNSEVKLMNLLKSWFDGHIAEVKMDENHYYQKQCYSWRTWAVNEQLEFLKNIEPYLFLKRKQAQICINFLENGGLGYKGVGVSDQEWNRREQLCKEIQKYNKRFTRLAAETECREQDNPVSDSPSYNEQKL